MKRLSIALAAIGISAGALAALPAATNPTEVSVPQLSGGFVIGATGFYLQPTDSNGDLDYASANVNNNSVSGATSFFNNVNLHNVEPGYDWGWGVNVGYIFPNTGNDVNLSYFRFDSKDTASTSVAGFNGLPPSAGFGSAGNFILPVGLTPANGDSYQNANARVDYDLDQVDLTAGQYINVGCRLTLHPFAGLRWAQLDRKLTENYFAPGSTSGTAGTVTIGNNGTLALNEKSDFEGIGPIAGLDATYYVDQGFGVVGHFDTGLLVGNIDSQTTEAMVGLNTTSSATPTVPASTFNATYKADSNHRLVPVADAKLGLDWTYLFNNTDNSDVTLEAGWQVSHYWNSVDRLTITDGSGAAITGRKTSDFGLSGPYLNVTVHV